MLSSDEIVDLTIKECAGIQPQFEVFYILSIAYAAERAQMAFLRLGEALSVRSDPSEVFSCLQEALTHVAALSRFFKPTKQGGDLAKARADKLRIFFQIDDRSPLYCGDASDLRNTLEHFDEKLDRFLTQFLAGQIIPGPIIGDVDKLNDPLTSYFRLIDPNQETCIIFGKRFEYGQFRREVVRILKLAKAKSEGSRL